MPAASAGTAQFKIIIFVTLCCSARGGVRTECLRTPVQTIRRGAPFVATVRVRQELRTAKRKETAVDDLRGPSGDEFTTNGDVRHALCIYVLAFFKHARSGQRVAAHPAACLLVPAARRAASR
jgi:hypothetical protein